MVWHQSCDGRLKDAIVWAGEDLLKVNISLRLNECVSLLFAEPWRNQLQHVAQGRN